MEANTTSDELLFRSTFSMLEGKVDDRIMKALSELGFTKPTEIQAKTLPYLLQGKDLIGAAKTGSGKTIAFLVPLIDMLIKLNFQRKHGTGGIILSPTRELALQTYEVLLKLLSDIDLSCTLIVGGEKKHKEIKLLERGATILVSTPGRLLDHLQNTKQLKTTNLQCLVVDEADKLLEAGFERDLTGIIGLLPNDRQTVLFSATIDGKVKNLARLALKSNPVIVSVKADSQSTVTGLKQGYYICEPHQRIPWLFKILKRCKKQKVMVFFSSCNSVDFHCQFFGSHCAANVISIHGKQSQAKRKEAYQKFVTVKSGTLFCTDVAARGLDIPAVDWIVQYDAPTDPKEYIHRVGRTARGLNNKGNAVLLLRKEEESFVEYLQNERVCLDKYVFEEPSPEIQLMLQDLILTNGVMKTLARKAYLSFLRCYRSHPLSNIFNIKCLDVKAAAMAFGFVEAPHVDFLSSSTKKKKRRLAVKEK